MGPDAVDEKGGDCDEGNDFAGEPVFALEEVV